MKPSTYVIARSYPDATISCSFVNGAFDDRPCGPAGNRGDCVLTASDDDDLRAVLTMITTAGDRVNPKTTRGVRAGGQTTLNISVVGWTPSPGLFDVQLTGHDNSVVGVAFESTSVV